jgi:sugar lactone lactonase YvrE
MFNHASAIARRFVGLVPFAAVLASPALSQAQVVAGATGSLQVLQDGGILNPATVAVRDGVAFVTESQLSRVGQLGGLFKVVTVGLNGEGLLGDAILLPQDFFPESITLDAVTNDLFIGSVFNGTIVRVPNGELVDVGFAGPAPNVLTRGAVGLKVDNVNNLLWACDSNAGAAEPLPGATLTGLSLVDASVVVTHEFPGANDFCNDITLDAAGNVFVTESTTGQVLTVDAANVLTANSLEVFVVSAGIAGNGGIGANGLALTGGGLFVANTSAGTIVRFDPAAADVAATEQIVAIVEGDVANTLLSGPDGLLAISDTEILVVENGLAGAGLNRLVKLTLDPLP